MTIVTNKHHRPRGGIPRGLAESGPALLSYGFRPFFLGAAIWACVAMILWILAITGEVEVGGSYGAVAWHAHEMLFGFGTAVVAGFLLTAVPNWTGRLPVSGRPLLALVLLWCAGRAVMLWPDLAGLAVTAAIDAAFPLAMLGVCLREVIAGRKWADLKVVAGLAVVSLADICFHGEVIVTGGLDHAPRLTLSAYTMMIVIVGGRMLPSFTRNWLARQGRTDFPAPYDRFDRAAILLTLPALVLWVALPDAWATAVAGALAASLHGIRLARWRGPATASEPLLLILHIAYALVPGAFVGIALAALGVIDQSAATHVLTVGTVAVMMLAVMTRATRGHTGQVLTASPRTCASYACLMLCAFVRPAASLLPATAYALYPLAALLWIAAFALYLQEYGPMLVRQRRQPAP
jgi:uncharacterized protein involved in response to NO